MVRIEKKIILAFIVLFLSALFLSGCTTPDGDAAQGQRWYRMHNCSGCHGENGNDGKGPNIAELDMNYRQFKNRLRNAETQVMPAYSEDKISDQDVADILAFLQKK